MSSPQDDDGPDAFLSVEIGICGVVLFGFLLILAMIALIASKKHKYSKRIFGFASLMCIFELPRCVSLIVERSYHDRTTYILHMFANLFFFMSFTFVCLLLHEAVDLSKTTSHLRSKLVLKRSKIETVLLTKHSLYLTNAIFLIFIIVTSVYCALSSSLFEFFRDDTMFQIYTCFDVSKNLVYSVALLFFGCKLRKRIKGFSNQFTIHQDSSFQEKLILNRLEFAVRKLIIVMSICIIAFLLRSIMLILKLLVVEQDNVDLAGFQAYGKQIFFVDWFLFCFLIYIFVYIFKISFTVSNVFRSLSSAFIRNALVVALGLSPSSSSRTRLHLFPGQYLSSHFLFHQIPNVLQGFFLQ
jgi:hypothetical protein